MMKNCIFLFIGYLSILCLPLHGQFNGSSDMSTNVPYADGKSFIIMVDQDNLYVLDFDINTRKADDKQLFVKPKDSIPAFKYDMNSPSLSIKKENYIPIGTDNVIVKNDLLEISLEPYMQSYRKVHAKVDSFYRYWFCGYYNLKETPVIQCGTTCFIGKQEDIKDGNYAVFGLNTCSKTNEIIYFLAWYEKKQLTKVWLSNGAVVTNFSKKYDSYQTLNYHLDNQRYIKEYISNAKCTDGCIASQDNKFYVKFDHGGLDLSYLFPESKQTGFKVQLLTGNIFMCTENMRDPEFYSQYGRPFPKIQLISEIVKEPIVLNFGKFNDPKGTTVVLGERKPKIEVQKYIEYDIHRNITVNIPRYDDPKGIDITYDDLISRWVVMAQIAEGGFVFRYVAETDGFNYFTQDNLVYDYSFLNSSLHKAVWSNHKDSVRLLIEQEPNINFINSDKQTPLHFAAYRNNKDIVKLLLDKGAEVYAPDNFRNTPMHMAAATGGAEIIKMLYQAGKKEENEYGVGINFNNILRQSPLDIAVAHDNLEAEKALLDLNAIVPTGFISGNNPLMQLCNKLTRPLNWQNWQKNYEMARLLLQKANWGRENFTMPLSQAGDSLFNVSVMKVRFYQRAPDKDEFKDRQYSQLFPSTNTRYIGVEMKLVFPKQTERKNFSYKLVWHASNTKELRTEQVNTYIDQGWDSGYYTSGFGDKRFGGYWKPGVYYLDVFMGQLRVATGYFMVF